MHLSALMTVWGSQRHFGPARAGTSGALTLPLPGSRMDAAIYEDGRILRVAESRKCSGAIKQLVISFDSNYNMVKMYTC